MVEAGGVGVGCGWRDYLGFLCFLFFVTCDGWALCSQNGFRDSDRNMIQLLLHSAMTTE